MFTEEYKYLWFRIARTIVLFSFYLLFLHTLHSATLTTTKCARWTMTNHRSLPFGRLLHLLRDDCQHETRGEAADVSQRSARPQQPPRAVCVALVQRDKASEPERANVQLAPSRRSCGVRGLISFYHINCICCKYEMKFALTPDAEERYLITVRVHSTLLHYLVEKR